MRVACVVDVNQNGAKSEHINGRITDTSQIVRRCRKEATSIENAGILSDPTGDVQQFLGDVAKYHLVGCRVLQRTEPDQSITAPHSRQCFARLYIRLFENLLPDRTEMIQCRFQLSGVSSKSPVQQPIAPYVSLAHRTYFRRNHLV